MKIGIISINMYSKKLNFACPLHTYAFQQFLLKNGIDNTIIDYRPVYSNKFDMKHPSDYYKKKMEKENYASGGGIVSTTTLTNYNKYKTAYEEREIRYDKFQNFINNNYIKTDICYNSDLLEVMDPGFDCYICATDVIWRKTRKWGFDRGFFLASTCMENKWKIAYSASRNTKVESTEEDTKLFFHYLDDIDYISVREENLKNYITENSNIKATTVLDPVLLHEKEFYKNIIEKPKEKNYVCIY